MLTVGTMTRSILLWPTLILTGTILALATLTIGHSASGYGFPFPWKTGRCPPPGIAISLSCLIAVGSDWLSVGVDAVMYTLVVYGLVLAYAKSQRGRRTR